MTEHNPDPLGLIRQSTIQPVNITVTGSRAHVSAYIDHLRDSGWSVLESTPIYTDRRQPDAVKVRLTLLVHLSDSTH